MYNLTKWNVSSARCEFPSNYYSWRNDISNETILLHSISDICEYGNMYLSRETRKVTLYLLFIIQKCIYFVKLGPKSSNFGGPLQ